MIQRFHGCWREVRAMAWMWLSVIVLATFAVVWPVAAKAQVPPFPSRPITLILPFPPGGATDVQIRALAQAASKELGQPIVIVNRPGVGGTLGPAVMAQSAAPDGYTISLVAATLFRLPHLMKVSFDPATDFTYLICLTGYTNGILVRQDAPWKTLQELLAYARANPGAVSYGSTGRGRVLATLGDSRLKRWPQVPTLKELGYDIVVNSPIGLAGPKGIDPKVVKVLHDAFRKAMNDPAYLRVLEQNDQVPIYMSSEDYTRYAVEQTAREKLFIQELSIKLD